MHTCAAAGSAVHTANMRMSGESARKLACEDRIVPFLSNATQRRRNGFSENHSIRHFPSGPYPNGQWPMIRTQPPRFKRFRGRYVTIPPPLLTFTPWKSSLIDGIRRLCGSFARNAPKSSWRGFPVNWVASTIYPQSRRPFTPRPNRCSDRLVG